MTDKDELERLILAHSPKFQAILSQSRRQIDETGGIPHEDFWPEVSAERKDGTLGVMKMKKRVAIARINELGGVPQLTQGNTRLANINDDPKNVWWVDVPLRMVSLASKADPVHLLLYDHKNDQLHHLAVPVEYFSKNRSRPVIRDDQSQGASVNWRMAPARRLTVQFVKQTV